MPQNFGYKHLTGLCWLFLLIIILLSILLFVRKKFNKGEQFDTKVIRYTCFFMWGLEIVKTIRMVNYSDYGPIGHYPLWMAPFHICSMGLYAYLILGSKKESTELKISHISTRGIIYMLMLYVVAQLAISLSLIHFTDSDVPWFNGLTSSLSIVGMWMLAKKLIEQWIVWFVVDILSVALYFYKGLEPTALLYSVYAIVAILGYKKWNKL